MTNATNEPIWVAGRPGSSPENVNPVSEFGLRSPEPGDSSTSPGVQMACSMRDKGYHPVALFGMTASGKSTLLSSLIGYLMRVPGASLDIEPGAILPGESEYAVRQRQEAIGFFQKNVHETVQGRRAAKTMTEAPFFIPVVVRPGNGLPEVRLAFLESKGEWYAPKPQSPEYYQPLKKEIEDVLSCFTRPISVLHIAPCHGDSDDAQMRQDADYGLRGAIKAYERVRDNRHYDHHLYLLTKWDLWARPHSEDNRFSNPDPELLYSMLHQRYNKSWTAYQSMNIGNSGGRRNVMQYCAGLFKDDRMATEMDDEITSVVDRYPRTVLNWLYSNATKDMGTEKVLFPDVLPVPRRKEKFREAFMRVAGLARL